MNLNRCNFVLWFRNEVFRGRNEFSINFYWSYLINIVFEIKPLFNFAKLVVIVFGSVNDWFKTFRNGSIWVILHFFNMTLNYMDERFTFASRLRALCFVASLSSSPNLMPPRSERLVDSMLGVLCLALLGWMTKGRTRDHATPQISSEQVLEPLRTQG